MFTITETIDNVPRPNFVTKDDFLIVLRRKGTECALSGYQKGVKSWEKIINGKLRLCFVYNDIVIVSDHRKRFLQINITNGEIIREVEGDLSPIRRIGENYLISKFIQDAYYPGLYSADFKLIWQLDTLPFFYQSTNIDRLIGFPRLKQPTVVDYGYFTKYDIDNGHENWSYDLSTQHNIFKEAHEVAVLKFLGVLGEYLWVGLNNGKILVLNEKTGEQKGIIGNPFYDDPYEKAVFPSTYNMEIDHKNNQVVGLFRQSYCEVDAQTFEVHHVNLESHFKQMEIYGGGIGAFDDHLIYFIDVDYYKLGVFNRATHQLEWQYAFLQEGSYPRFPLEFRKHGNNLYVLDSLERLHIFNKNQ